MTNPHCQEPEAWVPHPDEPEPVPSLEEWQQQQQQQQRQRAGGVVDITASRVGTDDSEGRREGVWASVGRAADEAQTRAAASVGSSNTPSTPSRWNAAYVATAPPHT